MSLLKEIILNNFQQLVFEKYGTYIDRIENIKADASDRKIYRLFSNGNTLVGIHNENRKENLAFINFTKTFTELGLNVPVTFGISEDCLFYIQEDLGDETLFSFIKKNNPDKLITCYKQSLADLIRFQIEAKDSIDYNFCYQTNEFNSDVINSDIQKFNQYYLKKFSGKILEEDLLERIRSVSEKVLSNVDCNYFLYRDFQPRNIMLKNNHLYYIDYQSGRKGPLQYDVASFLYSGSILLSEKERCMLIDFYLDEVNKYVTINKDEFKYYFYFFVFLRLLQVLGSYAFQSEQKNDNEVLKKIPKALDNLRSISDRIEEGEIREIISKLV